ncbi:hypothetical protein C1N27_14590 [Vibrio diazotrophicus]|nr:hypothetical protein C1N27_14590 [Vibrio diazotrophicus]
MIENEWGYTTVLDIADDAAFLMRSDLLSTDQHKVVSSVYTQLDELVENYITKVLLILKILFWVKSRFKWLMGVLMK